LVVTNLKQHQGSKLPNLLELRDAVRDSNQLNPFSCGVLQSCKIISGCNSDASTLKGNPSATRGISTLQCISAKCESMFEKMILFLGVYCYTWNDSLMKGIFRWSQSAWWPGNGRDKVLIWWTWTQIGTWNFCYDSYKMFVNHSVVWVIICLS
jgi:hypothetical protein